MPALSGRGIGAAVVAALVVAGAGWAAGNASSSGAGPGARDALPESFTPATDRVEIGTLARRRDLPELGGPGRSASTPKAAPKKTKQAASPGAVAFGMPPPPAAPPPPPPPPPPAFVPPPPPPQGTPGGEFDTGGTT